MALVELQNKGYLKYLISQNCDGLHRRSGILPVRLSSTCVFNGAFSNIDSRRRTKSQNFTVIAIANTAKIAEKNTYAVFFSFQPLSSHACIPLNSARFPRRINLRKVPPRPPHRPPLHAFKLLRPPPRHHNQLRRAAPRHGPLLRLLPRQRIRPLLSPGLFSYCYSCE